MGLSKYQKLLDYLLFLQPQISHLIGLDEINEHQQDIDNLNSIIESGKTNVVKNSYGICFCGNCRGSVWQNKDESKYCFRCGKRLEWNESES